MNTHNFQQNLRAVMLEATYHKKTYLSAIMLLTLAAWIAASGLASVIANNTSAAESANTSFQVNVQDTIAVAVTTPVSGATGNVDEFLRNTVDVSINTNVSNGFTASMYSRDNTNLTHTMLGSSYYIPTMSNSSQRSSFPVNTWGYSLKSASLDGKTYGETDAGNNNSTYYPLTDSTTSPIKVMTAASGTKSGTQSIYFGAKANAEKPAGTYLNTVVLSVVTGAVDSTTNPITPTNPATPSTDSNPNDTVPVYTGNTSTTGTGISGTAGTTVRTVRVTNSSATPPSTTTTTEVSAGDNTSSYAPAQGVSVTSQSNIVEQGSSLPLGLAATAVSTATAGVIFFVLAKRDEDDDEEEDLI